MSYSSSHLSPMDANIDFTTMNGGEAADMAYSPSFLSYDDFNFLGSDPSFFPATEDPPLYPPGPTQQEFMPAMPQKLTLNTSGTMSQGMNQNFQAGSIGDRLYGRQQAPIHGRNDSVTSPAILVGDNLVPNTTSPGQYGDRDFIKGSGNIIYFQASDDPTQSAGHNIDIDLIDRVSQGHNIQRPPVTGPNMSGIAALSIGIAATANRVAPIHSVLLNFLSQTTSKIIDGSAPQVKGHGIDRPLQLDHLLMIVHQYGLRNNSEQYNIGVIRSASPDPPQFGACAIYTIALRGPRTDDSKTIWLYEESGSWYPLASDNYQATTKTYADALKMGPSTQRPITLHSTSTHFLQPGLVSPSSLCTPSEAGSEATSLTSFSCRSCGKKCEGQAGLTHHNRNHRQRNLACPSCGKRFHYNKDLKRHESTHSDKSDRMNFPCPVNSCDKAYTRLDNLRRHQRADHPGLDLPASSVTSSRHSHSHNHGHGHGQGRPRHSSLPGC